MSVAADCVDTWLDEVPVATTGLLLPTIGRDTLGGMGVAILQLE